MLNYRISNSVQSIMKRDAYHKDKGSRPPQMSQWFPHGAYSVTVCGEVFIAETGWTGPARIGFGNPDPFETFWLHHHGPCIDGQ